MSTDLGGTGCGLRYQSRTSGFIVTTHTVVSAVDNVERILTCSHTLYGSSFESVPDVHVCILSLTRVLSVLVLVLLRPLDVACASLFSGLVACVCLTPSSWRNKPTCIWRGAAACKRRHSSGGHPILSRKRASREYCLCCAVPALP